MPPKETSKKAPPSQIVRPAISVSSLYYTPEDIIEGFSERIETGIDWTLIELAIRHHKNLCHKQQRTVTFSEALRSKIENSIFGNILNEESTLSLDEQWELLLPITLWDNEKFATEEGKICFKNANNFTDDMMKMIKKTVAAGDRKVLRKELKLVHVLRVNDCMASELVRDRVSKASSFSGTSVRLLILMTELDDKLREFKKLVSLNLCGNYIADIDASLLPQSVKSIELQANCIQSVLGFAEHLPSELLYLGLATNFLDNGTIMGLSHFPSNLSVLDLSDNDICELEAALEALSQLPNLTSLMLAGNPCSVCAAYAKATLKRLPRLRWLDLRQILPADRPQELDYFEPHPDDLRSSYFYFTVLRVMSAAMPPKPEKGAITTFHVELEIPLLDSKRRKFLMFRHNESLTEMLPPPEDYVNEELPSNTLSTGIDSKIFAPDPFSNLLLDIEPFLTINRAFCQNVGDSSLLSGSQMHDGLSLHLKRHEASSHESDIYKVLTSKNSLEIRNYTTFESNRVQWNKVMNFTEPAVKIFCPDLVALRNTFRTVITVRFVYSLTQTAKQAKPDKKSQVFKGPTEQQVVIATIRCALQRPDWSQPSQHFHWDDSLGNNDAIHWGDGDLAVLQYSQAPIKMKGKPGETAVDSRQLPPDNLTCHFGFGIETFRT